MSNDEFAMNKDELVWSTDDLDWNFPPKVSLEFDKALPTALEPSFHRTEKR